MKRIILILAAILLCSCSTIRGVKKSDKRIVTPERAQVDNRFIRYVDEKTNPEKQMITPKGFTKWTLSTGAFSFLLFQFLKWKHIV